MSIQVLGDDGKWKPFHGVVSWTMRMSDGTTHFTRNRPVPVASESSDDVTVTLADDATWEHMRGLYPGPEYYEGASQ